MLLGLTVLPLWSGAEGCLLFRWRAKPVAALPAGLYIDANGPYEPDGLMPAAPNGEFTIRMQPQNGGAIAIKSLRHRASAAKGNALESVEYSTAWRADGHGGQYLLLTTVAIDFAGGDILFVEVELDGQATIIQLRVDDRLEPC